MVPEMEKPRVTEIQVRIDCNGCVQKIKKALHGINGISDIYIDIPQQKLTIIGWADPEKIVKALKKTRKLATICSDTEQTHPTETPSEDGAVAPPPDPSNPPPADTVPQPEPVEPPKEPETPPPSEPTPEPSPPPVQEPPSTDSTPRQQTTQPSRSNEAEEVHVVYHYPPDHSNRYSHDMVYNATVEHYSGSPSPVYKHEPPQPIHVNHSYNTYKPTPYVTEYKYIRPPPQHAYCQKPEPPQQFTHYNRPEPPVQYTHYARPEPPLQYTHYARHEPPLQYTHYAKQEPAPQYTQYNRPEPPPSYTTQYNRPEPPPSYTQYNRPEPPQPYTNYGLPESPPQYTRYSGEYDSSRNGSGNITSIFSDENPNACTIV